MYHSTLGLRVIKRKERKKHYVLAFLAQIANDLIAFENAASCQERERTSVRERGERERERERERSQRERGKRERVRERDPHGGWMKAGAGQYEGKRGRVQGSGVRGV